MSVKKTAAFAALCAPAAFFSFAAAQQESFSARLELGREAVVRQAKAEAAAKAAKKDRFTTFPVRDGTWRIDIHWDFDPITLDDVLAAHLAFFPDPARAPMCRSIRIIQAAQMETAPGRQYQWPSLSGQSDRNLTRTPGGFYIDHDATKCSRGKSCSPYYRDSWSLPKESQDGENMPGRVEPASIADYPFGWDQFDQLRLETCARCADNGVFLGCVDWGAFWPRIGDRPPPFTPEVSDAPSPSFLSALRLFDSFYAGPAPSN